MVDEKNVGERLMKIETIVGRMKEDLDSIRSMIRWIAVVPVR